MPIWVWLLIAAVVVPFGGCFSWFVYAGAVGPDPEAKPGSQIPRRFVETIRRRGLLTATETPTYFSSNALTDIEDGMYFFTKEKLVAYSSSWDPPAIVVPLTSIERIDITRSTSWLENSNIMVEHGGGLWLEIPISGTNNGDQRFYEALNKAWKAPSAPTPAAPSGAR